MRVTIIRDDDRVVVNGESHTVDCSGLPVDVHALQWDGTRGEIEYRLMTCDHCGGRSKKPNEVISDVSQYRPYVDRWNVVKKADDAAKAAAEEKVRADASGPKN